MEFDRIAETVTNVVAEVAEMSSDDVWAQRDAHLFDDLGLDSLLALEIVAALERAYRIEVPEERIVEVTTVVEAINLVRETLGDGAGEAAR